MCVINNVYATKYLAGGGRDRVIRVQILMDGDIYDQFSPSQNIVPRSDVLKTLAPALPLSLSFARITLGRLGGANQVLTPITSFSGCGGRGRRPEWEEGMCSHLSQSLTPSFSVVESKEREHYTEQIPFSGWLVACKHETRKPHPICRVPVHEALHVKTM